VHGTQVEEETVSLDHTLKRGAYRGPLYGNLRLCYFSAGNYKVTCFLLWLGFEIAAMSNLGPSIISRAREIANDILAQREVKVLLKIDFL